MGGKNTKTTTTTKLPPSIEKAYNDLIAQAKPISNTPYQAYQGGVDGSGFEQNQLSAWNNIAGLAGSSNGAFNSAAGALDSTATPTYSNVNSYMSPYMDSVVKATMANMNEQNAEQQQGVLGNAAAQGALGGNRVGVAQAELARQQNLANQQTIANLYNSGYNTALSAAQSDKAAALQAAGQYSDLGSTAMQANLAQAAAQAAAGTQQQQYNYQQYQTERSYPFQTTSWLANIVSGLGSGMGGTTTSSQPSGNTGSSILGGLLGIGSLFLNKGGVVHGEEERPHRAQGGVIPYGGASGIVGANNNQPPAANDNLGYVPDAATGTLGPGHSTLPSAQGNQPSQSTDPTLGKGMEAMMSSVQKKYPNGILAGASPAPAASPASNVTSVPKAEVVPNPAADGSAGGGILSGLGKLFGFADGGVPHGYDAGGLVLPFNPDRFGTAGDEALGTDALAAALIADKAKADAKTDRVETPAAPVVDPQRFADGPVAQTPQALQKGLVSQQLNDGVLPPLQGPVADWPDRSGATIGDAAAPGTTAVPALPPPVDVAAAPKVAGVAAAPEGDGVIAPKAAEKPQNQYIEPFNKINADYGLPDGYLNRTAYIESRFDPQANNGISRGIFQFTGPTAGQYGLKNPYDPMASADAAARLASDNAKFLENGLGRPPTASELYLAHQQGAAGALNLLTHPNAAAADIVGRAAVVGNGGQGNMTAGQFANMWMKKYDGASAADSYVPAGGGRGTDVVNSPTATAQPSYTGVVPQEKTDNAQGIISSLLHGERPKVSDDVKMALLTAGLGMMASKSPFLGQGIGEGGLKGVEKWQELQKMHRENALAQSEIAGNQTRLGLEGVKTDIAGQNLALDAKKTASEIAKQTAETANLELANQTQRYQQTVTPAGIIVRDMTNPNAPPKLTTWEDIQRNGVPSEIKSNEAIGAGTASGSNTGAQGKTSRAPQASDADPQDKAVVAAPTKPVGGPVQVPDRIPVDTRLMSPTGQDIAKGETSEALKDARKEYLGASNSRIQLSEMKHDLATINDSSWTQPGTGFSNRVQWAKAVNTGFQTLGIEAPIDEKAVAAGEDLAKLTTRLGFDLSRSLGSNEAASVVDQSISAVPGGYNSPEGARRIIAGIEAANQRKIDHYQFLQQWSAKTGGSILGADEAFNQMYPPEAYVNNAMLSIATVPKSQADIDSAPKGTMFNINGNLMVK